MIFLLLSLTAFAQDVCSPQNNIAEERVIMPKEPEYFFKPIPLQNENDHRKEVSVIMDNSNWTIDMDNPANVVQIPGPYDGVPSPDGRFLVMPGNRGGLEFFDRNQMNRNDPKKIFDDEDNDSNMLEGVYHSIGVLDKTSNGNASYRIITDQLTSTEGRVSSLLYKDYATTTVNGQITFETNEQPSKPLCANMQDRYLKLPMISKDGRQLAAYDVESGTTKIFAINQENGNSVCNQTRDLGFAAGKVEFSPDGKKLTFAMDSHPTDPDEVEWYAQPPESKNYNVYMVDLEKDTMSRVSLNSKGNSYYPSFWYDESIIYLNQAENEEGDTEYSLVRTSFKNAPSIPLPRASNLNCGDVSKDFLALTALGSLWSELCLDLNKPVTLTGLAMQPLALDNAKCREMVENNWQKFTNGRDQRSILQRLQADNTSVDNNTLRERLYRGYLSLSLDDLLNACPDLGKAKELVSITASNVDTKIDPNENPMILCQQCHTAAAGSRAYDFSDPKSLAPHKAKMLTHVMTGFMPRNTPISKERRDRILEWIETNVPGQAVLPDYEND
jgi:hypothetical protein